jgi:hypothetical protein
VSLYLLVTGGRRQLWRSRRRRQWSWRLDRGDSEGLAGLHTDGVDALDVGKRDHMGELEGTSRCTASLVKAMIVRERSSFDLGQR